MEYGKLVNGKLEFAPTRELRYSESGKLKGNHYVHNFDEEELLAMGFKKLIYKEKLNENDDTIYLEKVDYIEIR